jgi:tRNA G10  N-methylase Trm11
MINQLGFRAKQDLKKTGVSSRFIELRDNTEVPTILSLKEKLISRGVEFGLFPNSFGVLAGLSNPEEWSKRDYDKPAGDKFSGMLPPKLARMMANLALGFTHGDSEEKRHLIVDPFCGSGNILIEALMLGCDVFGSDISAKAVDDTTKNIKWILSEYQLGDLRYQIAQADATMTDFGKTLMPEYLEKAYKGIAFVSEPYLGEPKKFKPTMNAVRGEYRKVKSIYLKFFENIASLNLPKNSVFCLVFPLVETLEGKRFSLYEESVDEISKIGYTQIQSPLIYGRDYQVVKREISLLTLN